MRLIAGILSVAFAISLSKAQHVQHAVATVDDEVLIYYPGRDPGALIEQELIDTLEEHVWGTAFGSDVWAFDLDAPVQPDERFATGTSRIGMPFSVEFSMLETNVDAEGATTGIFLGRMSAIGDFYTYGIYYSLNDYTTLIPLYSRVDQTALAQIAATSSYMWQCRLDAQGIYQYQQNLILQRTCLNNNASRVRQNSFMCLGIGLTSCYFLPVAGCTVGFICQLKNISDAWHWGNEYENQIHQNDRCLCWDTMTRRNNPDLETPTSACGIFNCPPTPNLFVPGAR